MYKVALINMPFASMHLPSIALTQLASVLKAKLGDEVEAELHYLNHELAAHVGCEKYARISDSVAATASGLGDWIFRRVAFPELEDNTDTYLQRYPGILGGEMRAGERELLWGIGDFLEELIDRYALDTYDLVGFTSMFAQNVASIAMARRLKARNPRVVTVMGGANCETSMGAVIARNVDVIDFVFSGPALRTFPRLVERLMRGEPEACHTMRGVFSGRKLEDRGVDTHREIGEELDINQSVALDYDGFIDSLAEKCPGVQPVLLFETSRGCWWGERAHCTFCGLNGTTMKYRAMQPELALEQFQSIFRYYPKVTRFEACDNILPRQYLKDVLPRLEPPEGASIFYEVKADLKNHEMKTLADAGVNAVQPGIEALSSDTLRLMHKGTSSFQNLRFLKYCLLYQIHPSWNLLIGFPGEEESVYERYAEVMPLLTHLPPPSGAYPVRFDRFSPYFTLARQYNLELEPMDFYGLIYPFSPEELNEMAYFLADQNYENEYVAATAKWVKTLETGCEQWNTRWHRRDRKDKPRLEMSLRGEHRVIVDSRSGESVEHRPSETGFRILDDADEKPAKLSKLAESLGLEQAEIDGETAYLRERGLIFEEGDKYLSLVMSPAEQVEVMEW